MRATGVRSRAAGGRVKARSGWQTVCGHTHMTRGELSAPESHRNLVDWCRRNGVDVLGVGSPWTADNEALYERYEGPERAAYYGGAVDQRALRHEEEIAAFIRGLNELSGGEPLFYLDNETPKGRYGHLWWIGWDYDFPAWHDYDQPFDRWMLAMEPPGHHEAEPMPYERRPYLEILGYQRSRGALGIWAHPTSWWYTPRGTFVTNIASEMAPHLLAEGSIDGIVVMGYRALHRSYLELWFALLDRGYRIPGLAEVDIGLSTAGDLGCPYLTWYRGNGGGAVEQIRRSVRTGSIFASSGPFVELEVDGVPMGGIVRTSPGRRHHVLLAVYPAREGEECAVELVGEGGKLVERIEGFGGGTVELDVEEVRVPSYLACIVTEGSHAAVSNPVYLRAEDGADPLPLSTELTVRFGSHSPWREGTLRLEDTAGNLLERWRVGGDLLRESVPAASRITLVSADGWKETRYLVNANLRVQELERYLYRGRFLEDYPGTAPGSVPAEAFRIDDLAAALGQLELSF